MGTGLKKRNITCSLILASTLLMLSLAFVPQEASATLASYVKSIEYVEISLSTVGPTSANLNKGQTFGNCVPFVTKMATGHDDNFPKAHPDIYMESGPKVTAARQITGGTLSIGVFVVEFDSPSKVRVQQGTFTIANGSSTGTASLTYSVTQSNAALVFYYKNNPSDVDDPHEALVAGYFSADNQLTFARNGTDGAISGHYFVFEAMTNEFSVQARSFSIPASGTSGNTSINSVATDKTFLIASYRSSYESDNPRSFDVNVYLNSQTQINAGRNYGASAGIEDIRVFAITFSGDELVQRGSFSYAASDAQEQYSLSSSVNTDEAIAWNGVAMPGPGTMMNASGSGTGFEDGYQRLKIVNSGATVQGDRAESATAATGRWEVIWWKQISPALTLANHGSGQAADKFTTPSSVTDILYRFKLTRIQTVTVDNLRVNFTTTGGIANGDVTACELWEDVDNDGAVDDPGDTLIQGSVTPSDGVITFTNNFSPSTSGTNYLVRATVSNLASDDTTTFSVGTDDIDEVEGGVTESGFITNATHTQDSSQVTKRWGENSNCDYTGVTQDTFLDSGSATWEEGGCNGSTAVRVGYRTDAGTRAMRALIKFNLSNIPITDSSQIASAYLKVNVDFVSTGSTINFDAYPVLKTWNGGDTCHDVSESGEATWQYQSNPTTWSTAGCDGSGSDRESTSAGTFSVSTTGWKSWDVTQSVKAMYASGNYYGWVLKSQNESGNNWFSFYSSEDTTASNRPYLEITYVSGTGDQFAYRRPIKIDHTKVDSSCAEGYPQNFPVLISLSNQIWLKTTANGGRIYSSSGYDIAFRDSGGINKLDHEIEKYDGSTGTLVAWVRIPTLSKTNDTTIYIYYGNSGVTADSSSPTAVWDSNFKAVWHLKENPAGTAPQMKNSLSSVNHCTSGGGMPAGSQTGGQIDGSLDFDGINSPYDYLDCGNDSSLQITGDLTVSAWVYVDSFGGQNSRLVTKNGGSSQRGWDLTLETSDSKAYFQIASNATTMVNVGTTGTVPIDQWIYYVGVYQAGSALRIYVNGDLNNSNIISIPASQYNSTNNVLMAGRTGCTDCYLDGNLDEVRVSTYPRDACWIKTEFNNQYSPSTFYSVGSEQNPAPTAVVLRSFRAERYDEGVLLKWRTGFEVSNLGFHLYREENGELIRLTPEPVAGTALLAGKLTRLSAGFSYSWWDIAPSSQLSAARYWLKDMDLNGTQTMHGPVTPVFSQEPLPQNLRPELLSEIGQRLQERYRDYWRIQELRERLIGRSSVISYQVSDGKLKAYYLKARRGALSSRPGADLLAQQYLAGGPAVKILVKEEGWYRVTQPALVEAGLNPNVNPHYLQLYVEGREQPIRLTGQGSGSSGSWDGIEFYGVGLDTPSTDTRVYWLVEGLRPGKRIGVSQSQGGQISSLSFVSTVERKDRVVYFDSLKNGEEGNFFGPVVSEVRVDQLLEVRHPDLSSPEEALLVVMLQGAWEGSHRVKVLLNDVAVGEVLFEGQSQGVLQVGVPQSLLEEGDNLVSLVAQGAEDYSVIDLIHLSYWHTYVADGDGLKLVARGGEYLSISGFSQPAIQVIDITAPDNLVEVLGEVKVQGGGYAVEFRVPGSGERTLLALTLDQVKSPSGVILNQPSSWRQVTDGYDLVMISHRDFLGALGLLKELRQSQGLLVALVDVEDLYDEFNFGHKSPQAIKDFLSRAKFSWKKPARFVLLVGDASFDPRNYLHMGGVDLMPTKLVDTCYFETASDDWFVDFNSDGVPEMAVGRLPVQTVQEASTVVSKIVGYESATPVSEAVLVADRMENEGDFNFEAATEQVRALLPADLLARKIFRGEFASDAEANAELLNGINRGPVLVNFTGHGSVGVWRGDLLTAEDASSLINAYRLPFFVSMTCLNGYFQAPYMDTLVEALLKAPQGGAVAVWTSSGMTEPDKQAVMNNALIQLLFSGQSITLGEAAARAKASVSDQDVRKTWIFFGDPSTMLK
jgi:hypothetical protein